MARCAHGARMIYLYVFALILGGILLGASLLLGGHSDHGSHDAHMPAGHGDPQGIESLMLSVLSVRFWTFFLPFFGLAGLLLRGFGLVESEILVAILSSGLGLFAGMFAMWLVRVMRAESSDSAAKAGDLVGKTGRLLVGFEKGGIGKLRLDVKGASLDLSCVSMDDEAIDVRDEVIVVEVEANRVKVARTRVSTP